MKLPSISQTSSSKDSSTSIPNAQLKKAINLIEKGKVVQEELDLTKQQVENLNIALLNDKLLIAEYHTKDSLNNKIIQALRISNANHRSMVVNLEDALTIQKKVTRKQKFKKWLTLVLGIGIGYLSFH